MLLAWWGQGMWLQFCRPHPFRFIFSSVTDLLHSFPSNTSATERSTLNSSIFAILPYGELWTHPRFTWIKFTFKGLNAPELGICDSCCSAFMMTADTFLPLQSVPTTRLVIQHIYNNGQRRAEKGNRHRTRFSRRPSFSPLFLFFVLNIILTCTGSVALGMETSSGSSVSTTYKVGTTKTTTSVQPTNTGNDNGDVVDEEGIPVQGTDSLPKPFDTSIGNTFHSTTCYPFFNLFLNDPDYINCLPLSAMLQVGWPIYYV